MKRKTEESTVSPPKKKKSVKSEIENKGVNSGEIKKKVNFMKNESKDTKKFKNVKTVAKNKESNAKAKGLNRSNKTQYEAKKDGNKFFKKFNKKDYSKENNKFVKDQKHGEKPKWSEMKKEKKHLRLVRRKAKTTAEVFEASHKAKLLAAQIQRKVVKPEFKLNLCKELHGLLKGHYKSIALTHDLSRVIQVLLKNSPEDIKNEITEELLDLMAQMVQSKYAQHAVKRILKYGTDFIRHEVIKKFFGHIVQLSAHSISAPIIDYAYGEFATKKERLHMQQEFYGELYRNTKDDKVKTLSDAYKGSPEMKAAILQSVKANVQRILDKNLHDSELLHSVLYDYISECSADERTELISTLSPLIVPLSNSLPGVNTASICVWQGTNKDKKTILKVVKEHAKSLAVHKTGYRLLLAIFDSVDDTVLVKKAIVSTLAANVKEIVKDHWGNMTLHWLVKPKDSSAFHPNLIKFLEEGTNSGTSKKDAHVRVTELREAILPALQENILAEPQFWLSNKTIMLLAVAVLSIESSKEILDALSKEICRPDWLISVDNKEILAVEDAGLHMCLKKLAILDKDHTGSTLGESIVEHLSDDTIKLWLPTNRGCFFLLKLIESNEGNVASRLRKKLKPHTSLLKEQKSEGAKLLLQNVQKK